MKGQEEAAVLGKGSPAPARSQLHECRACRAEPIEIGCGHLPGPRLGPECAHPYAATRSTRAWDRLASAAARGAVHCGYELVGHLDAPVQNAVASKEDHFDRWSIGKLELEEVSPVGSVGTCTFAIGAAGTLRSVALGRGQQPTPVPSL